MARGSQLPSVSGRRPVYRNSQIAHLVAIASDQYQKLTIAQPFGLQARIVAVKIAVIVFSVSAAPHLGETSDKISSSLHYGSILVRIESFVQYPKAIRLIIYDYSYDFTYHVRVIESNCDDSSDFFIVGGGVSAAASRPRLFKV